MVVSILVAFEYLMREEATKGMNFEVIILLVIPFGRTLQYAKNRMQHSPFCSPIKLVSNLWDQENNLSDMTSPI